MSRLTDDSPRHQSPRSEAQEYACVEHGPFVSRTGRCPRCREQGQSTGSGEMTKKAFGAEDVDLRKGGF